MASGRDRFYFPPPQSIDQGSIADRANRVAEGLATSGDLDGIQEDIDTIGGVANGAQTVATAAIAAATAADNKITNLINGGVRTIHTTNFTYTKPPNLVKLGIIESGGGGAGSNHGGDYYTPYPGGQGGGYIYYEYPAEFVPASIDVVVAAGRAGGSNILTPAKSSFGSLGDSPEGNFGSVGDPKGFIDATGSAPGNGGVSGILSSSGDTAVKPGGPGGNSFLASGVLGGTQAGGVAGKPGANAPMTGQTLAGGGGGGGGAMFQSLSSDTAPGGAGGFPGGAGGAGGRIYNNRANGGPGAPGFVATVEFLS